MEETSKKVRHTVGKWELVNEPEYDPNRHRWFYLVTSLHGIHKIEGANPEEAKANACLVSSAPSLLEALESVVSAFDISNEKYADWTGTHELYDAIIKVKEAIKLAKGNGES